MPVKSMVLIFFKTACDTGFKLKQKNSPMLSFNVSVCNSVFGPDKPIVKYVHKSIYKSVSTSSLLPDKLIIDSNVCSNKLVSFSSIRSSKPIHGSNVCLSKSITSRIACLCKSISGSDVRSIKLISVSFI